MNRFTSILSCRRLVLLLGLVVLVSCSKPEPSTTATVNDKSSKTAAASLEKSIAVLPFTDLSENSDQMYFADGLSADLINHLSMLPDLQVAGRESSFHYKGKQELLSSIGESLHVANILQGSVRKSGNQLRVSAQLVSAKDGFNIWSRTWDKQVSDVFTIQQQITEAVTTALSVTLGAGDFALPGMTRNIDAYDLTLRAQEQYNQFTPDNVFRAINLMEQAVKLDATFGRAWLQLGTMYNESPLILSKDQSADFADLAKHAFDQARAVSPDLPELLLVDAGKERNNGDFAKAEKDYRLYFEKNGYNSARAMEEYAQLLSRTGQLKAAIALLAKARQLEPLAPRFTYQLALHELTDNQVETALKEADYGLTLSGGDWLFNALRWQAALKQGDLRKAAELIRAFYARNGDVTDATVSRHFMEELAAILLDNDFDKSSEKIIALIHAPGVTPLELGYLARLVAVMGQPAIALSYWDGEMANMGIWDSIYTQMRQLPDFKRLLQEKGQLAYWRTSGKWADNCHAVGADDFECQ